MNESCERTDDRRPEQVLALATEVYQTVFDETEGFYGFEVGADLAYLLGAVLKDATCEWPENREILEILRRVLGPEHPVWAFVTVVDE
jgi:hypothetical protein